MSFPRYVGSAFIAVSIVSMPFTALAATYTWDNGGGDNLWSTAANWNPNLVPGSSGSVVFNTTSTANVTVDVNVRVHSLTINSGYTGTITQSGAVMVGTGGYIQGGGTFNGGSAPILIQRNLTLTGGTLRSTSGILSISGSLVRTGGTFTHNDGTVSLAGPADRTLAMSFPFNRLDIESTREDDLVGYWKLDETSGLKVFDSSGFGHGAPFDNVTFSADVAPVSFADTRSFRFSRSASEVHVPTTFSLGTSATVAFWMKLPLDNTLNGATGLQIAISDEVGLGNRYRVYVTNGQLKIDGDACQFSGTTYPNDGGWHHIAFAKSASTSSCSVFVDGSSVGSVAADAGVRTGTGMRIGNYSAFNVIGIIGLLDDVRAYNRALSASEVASLADGLYPVRTGGSTVTASTNITAASAFNIWNGTFDLDGNTLTAEGSLLNYDTLSVSGGLILSDSALSIAPYYIDIGTDMIATVVDADANIDGATQETLTISSDEDAFTLTETAVASGIFTGIIPSAHGASVNNDGIINSEDSCRFSVVLTYADPDDPSDVRTFTVTILDSFVQCGGEEAVNENTSGGGGRRNNPMPTSVGITSPQNTTGRDDDNEEGNDTDRPSSASIFSDVRTSDWFGLSVKSLIQRGIIEGYKDANGNPTGDFGPADPVTVGQILKIALLSAGKNLPSSLPLPENPTATDWSSPYIALAEKLNLDLASEISQRPAIRGEVIHTLIQLFQIKSNQSSNPFSDLPDTHPYQKDILTALSLGLVTGDDNATTVRPDDQINRAEVATLVMRFLSKL